MLAAAAGLLTPLAGAVLQEGIDVAAILVEYCNAEDRLNQDTRDALARRGLSVERFSQIKRGLAEARRHEERRRADDVAREMAALGFGAGA